MRLLLDEETLFNESQIASGDLREDLKLSGINTDRVGWPVMANNHYKYPWSEICGIKVVERAIANAKSMSIEEIHILHQ